MPRLVLGTTNKKKAGELVELLAPLGVTIENLADYSTALTIEETGDSFAANARLKAAGQARALGRWVLGEDSGLAVDALGGAPGIYSARYSGPAASDESNNMRLLEALARTPDAKRSGHYVCHLTLCDPQGEIRAESEAACRGRIRHEPAGRGGFGYDPLFEVIEYHRTFGELGSSVKAVLSHRARAVALLLPRCMELLDAGDWT